MVPTFNSNIRFRASGPGSGMYIRFSNLRDHIWLILVRLQLMLDSPALDRIVELPRDICGTQYQHTSIIVPNTVHLHKELGLDTP